MPFGHRQVGLNRHAKIQSAILLTVFLVGTVGFFYLLLK